MMRTSFPQRPGNLVAFPRSPYSWPGHSGPKASCKQLPRWLCHGGNLRSRAISARFPPHVLLACYVYVVTVSLSDEFPNLRRRALPAGYQRRGGHFLGSQEGCSPIRRDRANFVYLRPWALETSPRENAQPSNAGAPFLPAASLDLA